MTPPIIVWLRHDLRLHDHPALASAVGLKKPIICLYIDDIHSDYEKGGALRWWNHYALRDFEKSLAEIGGRLIVRSGGPLAILQEVILKTSADMVYWNRLYFPAYIKRDTQIKKTLQDQNVTIKSFKAGLLKEPHEVRNKQDGIYKVYTPFRRMAEQMGLDDQALGAVSAVDGYDGDLLSENIADVFPLPTKPNWAVGLKDSWEITEKQALLNVSNFAEKAMENYKDGRNFPSQEFVSRLSPYLARGMISPRKILSIIQKYPASKGRDHFVSEILWREFSYYLLYHFDYMEVSNFRPEWDIFPWENNLDFLKKWQQGKTGIPIVDAGMRELRQTGYIHNRVRMLVGSYLVKHLLVDWRHGEAWFRDNLVDFDVASNIASWQWVAGSGADAAPYFRIFNPVLQSKKFDPDGEYILKYIPELKGLSGNNLHAPWEASAFDLKIHNIHLGKTYPEPLVDLMKGRDKALALYNVIKQKRESLSS